MSEATILIVDSDPASLKFLSQLLTGKGYKVLQADQGREGITQAWRELPSLVLFDPALNDMHAEEFIKELRQDPRTEKTPILAISSDRTPQKKDMLLEIGVTECHFKDRDLVNTLPEVLASFLESSTTPGEPSGGYLIVFMSAKGGTGTSSLCANYAMSVAEQKPDETVAVVDLVLPLGSLASILGHEGRLDLVSLAEMSPEKITKDFLRKNLPNFPLWKTHLLPGASHPERSNELNVAQIPEIISVLQAVYDYVVIDLGRSLSRISLPIIMQADLLALVVSNDQSTVTLTKVICEFLREQGITDQKLYVILNRAIGLEGLTKPEIEDRLDLKIRTNLPHMRGDFTLANNLHQPVRTKYPQDAISLELKETTLEMISLMSDMRPRE
jgi:pilus assembly protein CpaE